MRVCQRCGGQSPDEIEACQVCGMVLPPVVEPNKQGGAQPTPAGPSHTVRMGTAAGAPQPAPVAKRSPFAQTMLGLAPAPQGSVPDVAHVANPMQARQPQTVEPQDPSNVAPSPSRTAITGRAHKVEMRRAHNRTMLGIPLQIPSMDTSGRSGTTVIGPGDPAPPPVPPPTNDPSKETLIGVAMPGIAPINPGVSQPEPEPEPEHVSPLPDSVPLAQMSEPAAKPSAHPATALRWVLASIAAVLGTVALVAIWWWRTPPKLQVSVRTDENGTDSILVECSNCNDASHVTMNGVSAQFSNHVARLQLAAPLHVGQNQVDLILSRSGSKAEPLQILVPVDFRAVGDLSGLSENPPKLRWLFQKAGAVEIEVDQKPLTFGVDGKAAYEVPLEDEITGQSSAAAPLERRIHYRVHGAHTSDGSLVLRTAITPLRIDSPGSTFVTESPNLKICGRTNSTAKVRTGSLEVAVDAQGSFCNDVVLTEHGKFNVWITAASPGSAPRRVMRTIERTPNLVAYAKTLFPQVAHEFAAEATQSSPIVAITGLVVEQSPLPSGSRFLLRREGGNNPESSFVQVTSFGTAQRKIGSHVTVFGEPSESLRGPDGRSMRGLIAAFEVPALQ